MKKSSENENFEKKILLAGNNVSAVKTVMVSESDCFSSHKKDKVEPE